MSFHLSQKSMNRLAGAHPLLVQVVIRAIELSSVDFAVVEGVRDDETQRRYVAQGVSKTLKSKHLIQPDGHGHAVDLHPLGMTDESSKRISTYAPVAAAMKEAAADLGIDVIWGAIGGASRTHPTMSWRRWARGERWAAYFPAS